MDTSGPESVFIEKRRKKRKNEVENGGKEREKGPKDCFRIYNNAGLSLVRMSFSPYTSLGSLI